MLLDYCVSAVAESNCSHSAGTLKRSFAFIICTICSAETTVINVSTDGGGRADHSDLVSVDVTCWIVSAEVPLSFVFFLLLTDCRFHFGVVVDVIFTPCFTQKC